MPTADEADRLGIFPGDMLPLSWLPNEGSQYNYMQELGRGMMIDAKYFKGPLATELAKKRRQARAKHIIPYDCWHARVVGDRVLCSKKTRFGIRGMGMLLGSVLAGKSIGICLACPDYQNFEEGEE